MATRDRRLLSILLLAGLCSAAALATDAPLNSVLYPEKRSVDVPFAASALVPGAAAEASVKYEEGQARIDVDYKRLSPALAFGGDITAYVLWAVTPGGTVENLGELIVTDTDGNGRFQTGQKDFALIVTAEPYSLVKRASELVVFSSQPTKDKRSKNSAFTYGGLVPGARRDATSVGGAAWSGSEPVVVAQARKVYGMAEQMGVAPAALQDAQVALGQATNFAKAGNTKQMTDYASRSIAASGAAIQTAQAAAAAKATADTAAKRQAEVLSLQQQAADSQRQAAQTAAAAEAAQKQAEEAEKARAAAAATAAQSQAERDALVADRDRLQNERDAMAANLVASLSKIADTKRTARGIVVTLPGSYFGPNNELTPAAKTAVSRLAGTALLAPGNNLRIEGYSDAGADEKTNMEFSMARANAVYNFLLQDGVAADRMVYEGYGPLYPVASNVTEEGRASNRRVEVIVASGVVMDAKTFAESQAGKAN